MDLRTMSVAELREKLTTGKIRVVDVAEHVLEKIEENREVHSFITVNEHLLDDARALDDKLARGEKTGELFGIPVAVKDNVMTKDMTTTCASKMLEHYKPDFDAVCIRRLKAADALFVGKTNMDEFAMGGSSETSYFGPSKNPLDLDRVPGGSSSGSATSIATGEAMLAVGTDTGGSIRQPASYCGVVGFKPSYGLVSRYGVASMANTLDTVGMLGNNAADVALGMRVMAGNDPLDATSTKLEKLEEENAHGPFRFVVPENMRTYVGDDEIYEAFEKAVETLKAAGHTVDTYKFDYLEHTIDAYQILMSAEVNSNLARFDGIRYGYRTESYDSTDDLFIRTRSEGFGEEAKRRIALGALYLSENTGQKLYKKAMQVRLAIKNELEAALEGYDAILTPTTVEKPPHFGTTTKHALKMYSSDIFNTPVNLGGFCALSLPLGGLAESLQLIGRRGDDAHVLAVGSVLEGVLHG